MRVRAWVAFCFVVMMVAPAMWAVTITWNGNGDGSDWHDPGNWDLVQVPTSADDVIVADTGGLDPLVSTDAAFAKSITIQDAATLTIAFAGCQVEDDITVEYLGILYMDGTITGDSELLADNLIVEGAYSVGGSSLPYPTLQLASKLTVVSGGFLVANGLNFSSADNAIPYAIEIHDNVDVLLFDYVNIIDASSTTAVILLDNVLSDPGIFTEFAISGSSPANIDATNYAGAGITVTPNLLGTGTLYGESLDIDPSGLVDWINLPTSTTWLGTTNTTWSVASNWSDGVPTGGVDAIIQTATNQPTITSAAACKSLIIDPSATLTISGSQELTVRGNWTNNGTFTANSSRVVFTDAASATVGGSSTTTFWNLRISEPGTIENSGVRWKASNDFEVLTGTVTINNVTGNDLEVSGRLLAGGATSFELKSGTAALVNTPTQSAVIGNLLSNGSGSSRPQINGPFKQLTLNGTTDIDGCMIDLSGATMISYGLIVNNTVTQFDNVSVLNAPSSITTAAMRLTGSNFPSTFNDFEISGSAPANIDANLVPASVFVFVDAATGGGGSLFGETLDIDNNEVLAWEGDTTLAQWTGTAGTNWFNSANWSNSSVPTTSNNAIISDVSGGSGNFPVIDSSQGSNANAKKLMIRPSASLTTAGTPILTLHNSLINDGVFLDAAGTVRFEGSTSGSVGGSSAPAFHHVVVNKSGSVSIGNSGVAWDIGGNLSVDGGVFEVNEVAGSPNCQIDGNLTVAASQVFVNMASEQSIIGGSVQNDGDISGGTTTAGTFTNNGDVSNFFSGVTNVASDFTNNGTINGTLTLSGTGTQSVVLNAPVGLVGFVVDGVSPQTVAVTGANSLDTTTFSAATPGNVTFNGDAIDVGIMTIENGCSLTLAANSSLGVLDIIFINGVFVNGTLRTAVGSGTVRPIFSGPGAVISFDNGSTADIDGLVVDGAGTDPYSIEFLNGATIAKFDNVSIINTAAASAGIYLGNVSAPASFGAFEISGTTPKNIDATGFTGSAINITQGPNSGGNRWGASFEIDPGSKLNWVTSGINVREDDEFGDPVVNGAAPTGNRAFGNQPVTAGVTADSTIFVKNIGGTTLSMSIPVWDSGDSSEFILDTSGFLTSLSPGQSTTFTVAFDPNSPGPKLATISFTHNAANETSPFEFDVGGTGTGPIPVTTDITADETWNFFGSPYQLNPTPGQNITVRNGATLTIDSSAGPVVIEWLDDGNCDFDFCIGDGASQPGTLVINAVNPITFKICPSGNVRVRNNGQITFTSSASTTSFIPMETSPNDLWGALIFEAGQTQQSDLQNCAFTRGGFDTREAALVIEDSENFTPILKNLTFTSPNLAGIKVLGKGLNTFREEAISGAITVTGGTYSLIVDNATSTVPIRFPSITGQTNPPALMRGTCSVGQSGGGAAPWAFADAWVFNCAAASKVQIVHGYVSGNESQRPTFKSVDTTPTNSDWVGFEESTTVHNNIFGDLGTVAFLDIRDAAIGVNVSKGSLIPQAGKETLRRFPGITAKHCNIGMRVETTASAANVYGYNTRIEECQFGAPNTADTCAFGVRVVHGRVEIRDSKVLGATAAGVQNGQPASADSYTDLTIRECRITTNAGTHGVRLTGNAADADVLIERTEIEGFNYGVRVEQASTWNVHRTLTVRDCFVNATGLTAIPIDPEIHQFPLPLQGGGSAPSGGTVTPSGGGATSSGGTVSSQTSEALVIAIRGLGDPFYFSFVPGGVTAGLDVVIEDCTVMQGDAGIRGVDLKNNCSVTVKRTIFKNSNNGFRAINSAAANCPYYFEECEFLSHKKEGALDERNVAGAFPTYYRCSFVGNTLYGVKDNAAPSSLASNCYWGAANGPDDDAGVINGSGDKVSLNVTVTPFLDSPFIGTLTGASPASASEFDVQETATVDADNLHVIDQTPFFTWVFGSDFEGDVQSAYHIQVDNNSDFSSTLWNTTKVVSTATSVEYAGGALTDGTVYYARIRLWNQHAVWGPWKELTFRMNTKPVAVGNTNRFPQDTVTISDVSPEYIWTCPTDAQGDPLQFTLNVDNDLGTGSPTSVTYASDDTSTAEWHFSGDGGNSWAPFPTGGIAAATGLLIRATPRAPLFDDTWSWTVFGRDGYEIGPISSEFDFDIGTSYLITGTAYESNGSTFASGAQVSLGYQGVQIGGPATANTSGFFSISTSAIIPKGDPVVLYFDDGVRDGGTVLQFIGENMNGPTDAFNQGTLIQDLVSTVDSRIDEKPLTNASFIDDSSVFPVAWAYDSGDDSVVLNGSISNFLYFFRGRFEQSGYLDLTQLAAPGGIYVDTTAWYRSNGHDIDAQQFYLFGSTTELTQGTILTAPTGNWDGIFRVIDSTICFDTPSLLAQGENGLRKRPVVRALGGNPCKKKCAGRWNGTADKDSGSLALTIPGFTTLSEFRRATIKNGFIDMTGGQFFATDTLFDNASARFQSALILSEFRDNSFINGSPDTYCILWESTSPVSVPYMQRIIFSGTGANNVRTATGNALPLQMHGCGGDEAGEGNEDDLMSPNDLINWFNEPPTGIKAIAGDGRIRIEWDASPQVIPSGSADYEVLWSTTDSGNFTSSLGTTESTFDVHEGLGNGVTRYYRVRVVDTVSGSISNQSVTVTATTAVASLSQLAPADVMESDLVPLTIVGKDTHFNSSTSIGSTTGVNLTGKIVLSPTLILCTADVDDPNAPASATITATTLDIWNLTVVYNESVNKSLPIADFLHQTNRPTVSYVPNTPSQGGNTSGPFELDLAFSANSGAQINSSTFEFIASRDVTVALANVPAGNDLSGIFSVSTSGASADIDQTAATELFADGEYTVSARVQNDAGLWSDWVSRTFYVEGADADVAKSSTLLYQGVNDQSVVITGTGFTGATDVDFGANIFVNDFTVNSNTQITADVDVEQLAVCGPRTFTVTKAVGSATGVITVEYPTNLYFSISNDEPARNAAVGGVNVFLINGEFFQGKTDIATRGRMMGISWSRFHRSEMTYNGPLGQGWVGHYYQRVKEQVGTGHILWYTPGGRIETFTNLGTGNYANPAGVYVKASKDAANGTITLMDRHRYLCTFGLNDGRLLRCTDRNGNFTECTYNAAGQLVQITDDRGFFHKVVYYPHGRVQKVQDFVWDDVTPREVVYTYDDNGDLVTQAAPETERFEDADGNRITYAYKYDSKHRITACINPREFEENESEPLAYLENFYDTAGRVYRQRYGEQDETIYLRYPTSSTVNVLDRRGLRTEYVINGNGTTNRIRRHTSLWTVDDPWNSTSGVTAIPGSKFRSTDPANYETIFSYTSQLEVQFVSYPRGNNVSYTYPNPSTLFSATSSQSITATTLQRTGTGWTPGAYAGKTLRMGNAPGPFLYYPIISNTTSTLTINSNFSLTGDGWTTSDDYAILNDNGDPLAQGNVLAVTRSIGSIPGTETDIVTRYTYEPRYQFVKTVEQPRTDTEAGDFTTTYTYDYELTTGGVDKAFGNLVRVTSPNIVLGQPSAQQIVTNTTYNEFGQVVSTTDGEGNVTLMEYYPENDPNGRAGFLKRSIAGYGVLDLFGENDYDRVGNLISSLPPRAFESGGPDLRFQVTHEVNELNQTFHTTGPQLLESGSTARADVYRFFDANFNTVQTFREYVTESGTEPPAPSGAQIHDPNFFITNKSTTPMAATYVESSVEYNLLNYPVSSTVDSVAAGTYIQTLTSRTVYDKNYNAIESISPLGNRSRTIFDERDLVFRSIAGADSDVAATYESDYDLNGNLDKSRDALGNQSVYQYDGFDRAVRVTDPAGHYSETDYDQNSNVTESRSYDVNGVLLAQSFSQYDEIDRNFQSDTLALDHNGIPIGDGLSTNVTLFDKNSRVVNSRNDNHIFSHQFYDAVNRTVVSRDNLGNEMEYVYDANSNNVKTIIREVNGLTGAIEIAHTESDYDFLDRRLRFRDTRYDYVSFNFDTETETKYDGWSRVTTSIDAADVQVSMTYDLLSRSVRSTRKPSSDPATWAITETLYDDDSRVTVRRIANDPQTLTSWQETSYDFDERSRAFATRRADGDIWKMDFDANSNVISTEDPLGTRIINAYDERNLIVTRHIERGAGIMGVTDEDYEFDGLGRLVAQSNHEGQKFISSTSWEYNTLSLPESQTQVMGDWQGNIIAVRAPDANTGFEAFYNSFTTKHEYDETGFIMAKTSWDGRRIRNTRDDLNRLASSYDERNDVLLAEYVYSGPGRLIQTKNGDGSVTSYEYESAGCGCGGFTNFVERVASVDANGRTLFGTNRRYDVLGNVTAEAHDHNGQLGNVFRYDDMYRLEANYAGVDLTGGNIDTFADQSTTPSNFGSKTAYSLDPKGNRTGAEGTKVTAQGGGTIKSTNYAVSGDNMNLYSAVDGQTFDFDAIEQMTFDPATNTQYCYDYKGQLVEETTLNPETGEFDNKRVYGYDNQGRVFNTESLNDDGGGPQSEGKTVSVSAIFCQSCGCSGGGGDEKDADILLTDFVQGCVDEQTQYDRGVIPGAGGGGGTHPLTAATPNSASCNETGIVHELVTKYVECEWIAEFHRYRHHDQLGSLMGTTDENGNITSANDYTPYGDTMQKPVTGDFPDQPLSAGSGGGVTVVSGFSGGPAPVWSQAMGQMAVFTDPAGGQAAGRVLIVDPFNGPIIEVSDPTGAIDNLINGAANNIDVRFEQFNTGYAEGYWDSVQYIVGLNITRLIDGDAEFQNVKANGEVNTDITQAAIHTATVVDNITLEIPGNITGIAQTGDRYRADVDKTVQTGRWTAVSFSAGFTTLTRAFYDTFDILPGPLGGDKLQPDVNVPVYFDIVSTNGFQIIVEGNATSIAQINDSFRIFLPPGVDGIGENGFPVPDLDASDQGSSRYLWAGYRYVPPINGGIGGSTSSGAGLSHAWNRYYNSSIGRWTTTDPAASPLENLMDYCGSGPVGARDLRGLYTLVNARGATRYESGWFSNKAIKVNSSYTLGEDNKKLPSECCPCCLFIWVHGINNSLGEAMNGFTSVENSYNGWCYVVGFAWYSDPKTRAGFNTLDFGVKKQAANQVATGAFTQFIKDFRTKCPDTRINLGGHSLGARVILKALSAGLKVGTVLLAAAAVDNESLKTEFSAAPANAERIYNGYNPSDKVLQFAYTAWEWDTALGEEGEETPVGGNVSSYKFTEWKTDHSGVYDQNVNRNYWDTFSSTTNGKCPAAESPANKGKQWK